MAKAPKVREEEALQAPEEQAKGPGKRRRVEGPISLHPLGFEEAVDALLEVRLDPEEMRNRKG